MTMTYTPPTVLDHIYEPRGVQLQMFKERRREVLLAGPAGTGKSRACLEKMHHFSLCFPGMQSLIVRKTRESLTGAALKTFQRDVIPEAKANGTVWFYGGSTQDPPAYRYLNGSQILIGGMDKASKVLSTEFSMIYVQEATELTEDDWETLTTRLRSGVAPYHQIIADCNPDTPTHWLKMRADRGQTLMLNTRHEENPLYFNDDGTMTAAGRDYIEGILDKLTGVRYDRYRRGNWVAAEGIIYADFDPAVHIIDPFEVPEDWPRYWSVDFGTRNPFVWQMWAEDPRNGNLYLIKEIYYSERMVKDHCVTIRELAHGTPAPQRVLCDHQLQERLTLEAELGIRTTAANKEVGVGINAVQARFKERRIFFFRDCLHERDPKLVQAKLPASTLEEIPGYVWNDAKNAKEGPKKENDHGMDAKRYLCVFRDVRSQMNFRTLGRHR